MLTESQLADCVEHIATLKDKRASALAQKVNDGLYNDCKNEDARKAAAAVAMFDIDAELRSWERNEREARLDYDIAVNDTNMVAALLQLAAIEKVG